MKHTNKLFHSFILIFIAIVVLPIMMAGCQSNSPMQNPSQIEPEDVSVVQPESPSNEPVDNSQPAIIVDFSGIAQDVSLNIIPAISPNDESPYWEILPEHQILTLQGYPISKHLMKPQIFVYPVSQFEAFNPGAASIAAELSQLLMDEKVGENMPFLPLFNAAQVMHSKVEYMEFRNGKGVRYLTQFDQAPIPLNNYELIYTFQGLTTDGKYYVAAVFPVTHPDLPVDDKVTFDEQYSVEKFVADMAESIGMLENQPRDSFAPDLSVLDAMIQTLEIK